MHDSCRFGPPLPVQVAEANKRAGPAAHLQLVTPLQVDMRKQGMKVSAVQLHL